MIFYAINCRYLSSEVLHCPISKYWIVN